MKYEVFSFIVGFIDGDGYIKVLKRKTSNINIDLHIHSSWLKNLQFMEDFIFRYFNFPKNRTYSKLTKAGYAKLVFSNTHNKRNIFKSN